MHRIRLANTSAACFLRRVAITAELFASPSGTRGSRPIQGRRRKTVIGLEQGVSGIIRKVAHYRDGSDGAVILSATVI
jgi:hypothetical protein